MLPMPPIAAARSGLLFGALLATAAEATAQTTPVVDPPLFRYMPGGRATGFPFGYPKRQTVRHQEIHDGLAGTARAISAVALRRTGSSVTIPAFQAVCSLRLSTARHPAAQIASAFAQNTGNDVATVLDRRTIAFPQNVPPTGTELPTFAYTVPTTQPYAFAGSGPLCIELVSHSHDSRTPFTFDLYQEGRAHTALFGDACGGLDQRPTLSATRITHDVTGLPADSPLFFLAGFPLNDPVDLTPLGAPGCMQAVSLSVIVPDFATSSGTYTTTFDTTLAPPGGFYASQVMAVKPGINVLGAVVSQANLVLPIGARDAGRVWSEDLTAATGTVQPVFSLVVEVR